MKCKTVMSAISDLMCSMSENKKRVNDKNDTKILKINKPVDPVAVGMFIAQNRDRHNLTQEQLADKIFISRKAISKWETGKGLPSIDFWRPLCDELNISLDELLSGEFIDKTSETKSGISRRILSSPHFKLSVIITSILLLFFILCYLILHLNSNLIYVINYEDDNFTISKGVITFSSSECLVNLGEFHSDLLEDHNFSFELYYMNKDDNTEYEIVSFTGTNHIFTSKKICDTLKTTVEKSDSRSLYLKVVYLDDTGNDTYFKLDLTHSLTKKLSLDKHLIKDNSKSFEYDPKLDEPISDAAPANYTDDDVPLNSINVKFFFDMTPKELKDRFDGKTITVDNIDYEISYDSANNALKFYCLSNGLYGFDFKNFRFIYADGDSMKMFPINDSYNIIFNSNRLKYYNNIFDLTTKLKDY